MAVAIIAEYNPFHNGHKYQLDEVKKLFPGEDIIVFMSDEFVQRGERAIVSAEKRIETAISYGVSKVVLLPFEVSTQAAHIFASGAVKMVAEHKIDKLYFGSESNDVATLMKIAQLLKEKGPEYSKELKVNLKQGLSFPKSAEIALNHISGQSFVLPNDILGFEYCKAIINNNYNIKPYSLKRTISFHSTETENEFASATKIRNMIKDGEDVSKYTPMKFDSLLPTIESEYPQFQNIVNTLSASEIAEFKLVSEGMENLFKKHIDALTYDEFVNRTNSKRYTSSRIKRVMLYVLLQIKK